MGMARVQEVRVTKHLDVRAAQGTSERILRRLQPASLCEMRRLRLTPDSAAWVAR